MVKLYGTIAGVLDRTVSRPVYVIDDLAELQGPAHGEVVLPLF